MASFRLSHLVRPFSTSVVRQGQIVNAPIKIFGLEGRYAHALYSAASKEKKLDVVEKELQNFGTLLKTDPQLLNFLQNPSFKKLEKQATLNDITKKRNYCNLTNNFLATLGENGRINKVGSMIGAYEKLMSATRGEIECVVTTAKPLDKNQSKEVTTILNGFLKKGEQIQLEMKVDPSLIGGMTVTLGDKFIDMSMASKINTYTNLIKESI